MKTLMKTLATSIIATTLLFTACKKGDTGPAGATGANGSANVTTQTYTVTSWIDVGSGYQWSTNLNVTALSASTQSKAAVEVFLSVDSAKHWKALPYTDFGGQPVYMNFTTSTNSVQITWFNSFGNTISDPNTAFGTNCQFKVVVIPPAMVKPNVNTHDYNTIKAAYNL